MTDEYLIAFSSFYKASYAQEKLAEAGIRTTAKRLPPEVVHSCGYALTFRGTPQTAENAVQILENNEIGHKGVFILTERNGKPVYNRIG